MYKKFLLLILLVCGCSTLYGYRAYPSRLIPDLYLGFETGPVFQLKQGQGNGSGGLNFDGRSIDGRFELTGLVGLNAGYRVNSVFRADVSYSFFRTPYKWETIFPTRRSNFQSTLVSHLFLFNVYLHIKPFLPALCRFDPYVGGGIGASSNELKGTEEHDAVTDNFISGIRSFVSTNLAGRFGIGMMNRVCRGFQLDLAFFAHFIGTIETGRRRDLPNGEREIIGAFVFENNWTATITAGLKYVF